jgi:beta-fructofuranosidase
VTQGHATSWDLRSWEHKGTTFAPAEAPAWDDYTTWTGSVVQDDDGLWHLFYTGARRSEDGLKQRIGHATSTDLHTWQRVGDGLALDLSGDLYEEYAPDHWHDRAMRDPWVMRDPQGGWMMFFTARIPGVPEPNAGGAIGFATSPDLYDWTLQPPAYAGGTFGQMEVPQVLENGGRWYCLFCTDVQHYSKAYAPPTRASRFEGRTTWSRPTRGGRGRWRPDCYWTAIRRSTATRRGSSRPRTG